MQRHAAFAIPLCAGNFRAAQAASALHSYTFGAHTQSARDALLHGAAEGDTTLKLQSDIFRGQLSIQVRPAHFVDVDVGLAMGELGNFFLELFDFGALLADNDAGTCCMYVDLSLIRRPFDFDARDTRM